MKMPEADFQNNYQLHPKINMKLMKIFEDKESDWERRAGNGGKERMGEMERLAVENKKLG